jgi:hypothetical protein
VDRKYTKLPDLITSLAQKPGPMIHTLIEQALSASDQARRTAHDQMELLGHIGRRQVRAALKSRLVGKRSPATREEIIYSLGKVGDGDFDVAECLLEEVTRATAVFARSKRKSATECAAHALLAVRRTRATLTQLGVLREKLTDPNLLAALTGMDDYLSSTGGMPRLGAYAAAALAEVEARTPTA